MISLTAGKCLDYYGSMVSTLRIWRLALIPALVLATLPAWSQEAAPPNAATASPAAAPSAQRAAMDAQLFYELLVGEMAAAQGDLTNAVALLMEAARQTQSEALYQRAADLALQSRSGTRALGVAREWQQNLPQSRLANRYVLQILISLNRIAESEAALSREIGWTPLAAKPSAYLTIAQLYSHASDKVLASAVIEAALQADVQIATLAAPAWATIGHTRLMAKHPDLALAAAQNAYNADPLHGATALLALELLEAGVTSAEPLTQDYMQHQPAPAIQMAYVRVMMGLDRMAHAQQQLSTLLKQQPDMPDAWLAQAALAQMRKDWTAALSAVAKMESLLLNNDNPESAQLLNKGYLLAARVELQQKHYAQAQQWLEKITDDTDILTVQSLRALALAKQGKLAQGRALIRAIPAQNAAQERAKRRAEIALLRDADAPQEAYLLQRTLYEQSPKDVDIAYDTALMAEHAGKLEVMEKILREIIRQHPDHHHARNALGYSFADRGIRLQEARQLITSALEQAPGDPFITDSLAWVEFRTGNLPRALQLLEQAYATRQDPDIAAHLGEVLWALGRKSDARQVWRSAQEQDPDNATLRSTLQRLQVKL